MKIFIILLIGFVCVSTHAQTVVGQVIQATGNSISNSSFSLDYSIGEIAIETIASPTNYLTQGILQSTLVSVSTETVMAISSYIHVYPNPTTTAAGFKINTEELIEKITVMNTLGQVEYFYSNDIQPTFRGLLILYVKTDKGSYTSKIEVL